MSEMSALLLGGLVGGVAGTIAYFRAEESWYWELIHWTTVIPFITFILALVLYATGNVDGAWVLLTAAATAGWAAGAYLISAIPGL